MPQVVPQKREQMIREDCMTEVQSSPFEDFQAISGSARAEFSTVLAMPDSTTEMTVIVDTLAEVRVDLRDILGQPVVGGSMLGSVSARLFTMKGVKEMDLPVRWDPARGFYAASWTPLPPDPIFQDDVSTGRYYRQLIVRLDGNQIINSPMPVTILLAISDPSQSFVMAGDYTIAKAGEPVWYQVRSATLAGRLRVTGGDVYEVLFEGPAHDPLMGDDRFDGTVIDNLNGSYTVNFEIQRPGYYNMRVFLNTVEIGPSPFLGVLIWDDLSAPLTTAFGPGISPAQNVPGNPARIIAGVNTSFDISAKDSYDVQYFRGGGMFRLSTPVMDMGPGVNVTFDSGFTSPEDYSFITDNNDGSYSVEYRLCQAGLTAMTIELYTTEAWRPIGSSPFLLQVLRGELVAETSKVHPPISQVFSGVPNTMQVDLRDACGLLGLYISLERIENGTQEALVFEAVRSTPGEVTVFFTPMQRGEHRLVVLGDGVPVQRAPMYFTVMPATSVPDSRNWLLPAIGAQHEGRCREGPAFEHPRLGVVSLCPFQAGSRKH
ncbi:Gelation factor (Actin-binding protein 120) (ABP-120) [Durusdinium trenchii]|uniref:Gelation factor (Actin-binding protein 120) (ABP-120) n=1 Tax=Durusdinium trenchii TaxID=1381693 RepID=A0ABP0M2I3_9DINO